MSNLVRSIKGRGLVFLIMIVFILDIFLDAARAQEDVKTKVLDLTFKILDLKFQTEDLKGATQDLQVKETETEVKIELSGDILFDFDKWDIRPAAEPVLQRVADIIKEYPNANILIEGYTDSKGPDSYNQKLSERRADSVKDWLVRKGGVNGKRVKAKGLGELNPVAPNENPDGSDNPEGRQKNRRVEITVKK